MTFVSHQLSSLCLKCKVVGIFDRCKRVEFPYSLIMHLIVHVAKHKDPKLKRHCNNYQYKVVGSLPFRSLLHMENIGRKTISRFDHYFAPEKNELNISAT